MSYKVGNIYTIKKNIPDFTLNRSAIGTVWILNKIFFNEFVDDYRYKTYEFISNNNTVMKKKYDLGYQEFNLMHLSHEDIVLYLNEIK